MLRSFFLCSSGEGTSYSLAYKAGLGRGHEIHVDQDVPPIFSTSHYLHSSLQSRACYHLSSSWQWWQLIYLMWKTHSAWVDLWFFSLFGFFFFFPLSCSSSCMHVSSYARHGQMLNEAAASYQLSNTSYTYMPFWKQATTGLGWAHGVSPTPLKGLCHG